MRVKCYLYLICLLFSFEVNTEITAYTKESLLSTLDTVCGDSWCCGEYDYTFKDIQFDFTKNMTIIFYDKIRDNISNSYECRISGYSGVDSIIGSKFEIDSDFYLQLGECLKQ